MKLVGIGDGIAQVLEEAAQESSLYGSEGTRSYLDPTLGVAPFDPLVGSGCA